MGYSEVYCKLCGVSFTIGRIRQANEPWENGWAHRENRPQGYDGHAEDERYNYIQKDPFPGTRCPPEKGCCNVSRKAAVQSSGAHMDFANGLSSYRQLRSDLLEGSISVKAENPSDLRLSVDKWEGVMEDDTNDTDYSSRSDPDDEPYEYHSEDGNDQNIGNTSSLDQLNESPTAPCLNGGFYAAMKADAVSSYFAPFNGSSVPADQTPEIAEMNTESDENDDTPSSTQGWEASRDYRLKCIATEHLAGPHCINKFGYSGFEIKAEEMKGCNVMQCLLRKEPDWSPEYDDQPFELISTYYLSSLSGYVPSRDNGLGPAYIQDRHNHGEDRIPDDILWHTSEDASTPMPFHPTCFDIFTRVSRLRLGKVDIEGLAAWRSRESDFYNKFPRHPAVMRGNGQSWTHVRGDEFLAANPVLIPDLPGVLRDATEVDANFSVHDSAFGLDSQDVISSAQNSSLPRDPFLRLPSEIINLLLEYLSSRDIAHLRLSSHAFRHLPITLFRRLLRDEVPWLWEVWDDAEPSIWAIHTAASMQECSTWPSRLANQLCNEQKLYKDIITREMPEVWEAYREDHPWLTIDHNLLEKAMKQEMLRKYEDTVPILRLVAERTNWYTVYCTITKHRKTLKGLRNRERIWQDIEEIVRRIRWHHEEGEIAAA